MGASPVKNSEYKFRFIKMYQKHCSVSHHASKLTNSKFIPNDTGDIRILYHFTDSIGESLMFCDHALIPN